MFKAHLVLCAYFGVKLGDNPTWYWGTVIKSSIKLSNW